VTIDVLRIDRWERLPAPEGYELAVILGSDASLTGVPRGWVARVLDWIGAADRAGVAILGICFGAQALAITLGGSVVALPEPEYAWTRVRTRDDGRVPGGPWLNAHHDAIVAPPGAVELAADVHGVQAFTAGRHLGVQFHPEVTPPIVTRWVAEYPEIGRRLLTDLAARCRSAAPSALAMFDAFLDAAVPAAGSEAAPC
jgi:GMP synthase-like glutamine amidotransferase